MITKILFPTPLLYHSIPLLHLITTIFRILYPVVGSSPAISDNDAACGRLLHLSVMQAPDFAKAWSTLASWCYRWGRKAVDIARYVSLFPQGKSHCFLNVSCIVHSIVKLPGKGPPIVTALLITRGICLFPTILSWNKVFN